MISSSGSSISTITLSNSGYNLTSISWLSTSGSHRQQQKKGCVYVWGGFNYSGLVTLQRIDHRPDSSAYIKMWSIPLLEEAKKLAGDDWILQQDNAPWHVSEESIDYSKKKELIYSHGLPDHQI
jgi:hypothetical protein